VSREHEGLRRPEPQPQRHEAKSSPVPAAAPLCHAGAASGAVLYAPPGTAETPPQPRPRWHWWVWAL